MTYQTYRKGRKKGQWPPANASRRRLKALVIWFFTVLSEMPSLSALPPCSDTGSYLEVLTAQQTLLSARLERAQQTFDKIQGMIRLYHALGGG